MSTTTVLRPSSTSSGVGWTPSTGTLHGVTSDDSDATYATWGGGDFPLILATPVDSPPVGERRHAVRIRARGEDGSAWWAVRLSSGGLVAGAAAEFPSSPDTVTGSWGFGAPADGPTILSTYVTGQDGSLRIQELYLDVDSREAPTFTAQILDGSGTATTTISDTAQPTVRASAIDLDGLAARWYRYWVTLDGAIVWDTGVVSGSSVNRQTTALDNGSYVAHLQIWTTLGANTEYPSTEETISFTVQVGQVDAPNDPTVTPVTDSPFYSIQACAPFVEDMDGGVGYVEVQRVDCPVGGYLLTTGTLGEYASTPDTATALTGLQVTVVAARNGSWANPGSYQTMAAQWDQPGEQGWWFLLDPDGRLVLQWSEDGTNIAYAAVATERPPIDPFGVARIRVTLLPDNGTGGWTVTYEAIFETDGDWAQLGEQLIWTPDTTSIFNSSAPYTVGAYLATGLAVERFDGRFYSVEVRDGAAGTVVVNPDFTGHISGTTTFTDGVGNLWTVHSPAALFSPVSTVTVAMLGPLASDECAEWIDFTLPRSGVGITCDHAPEPCCSYYRARTIGRVDGDLRISDWSDASDPALPSRLVVMWPSTEASIPAGWERVSELDGLYLKGVPDATTQPGTLGGAATHTHTLPTHAHDTSHSHTHTGNTSAGVGSVSSNDGAVGTTVIASSHVHTRGTTDTATIDSGASTPSVDTESNDVARLEVIFVKPDGSATGVPDGALAFTLDAALSGWTDYSDAANRMIKGVIGASGGTTIGSALDSHTHALGAHTHTGTAHGHTAVTNTVTSNLSLFAGAQSALWTASHSHPITVTSASSQSLASGGGANSGAAAASMLPPYRNLRVRENTSGIPDLPIGLICAWRGSLGTIPENWQLCDGTNGTPDMLGRYARGATSGIADAGGSSSPHSHTSPTHGHTTTGHSHTETVGSAAAATASVSTTATVSVSTGTHTHTAGDTNSSTPTVTDSASGTLVDAVSEPPYEEVAFIQMLAEPSPSPDIDTFCLTWDTDEHLIRTNSPDGPIWAPVLGKFEWNVDRPFTVATGVGGSRFVTSAPPGGRNLSMVAAVESEADLATLRAVLARPLVLISPSDADEVWAAPVTESVRIIKIGRIRQVTASFIGTGPEPPPQLADVGV